MRNKPNVLFIMSDSLFAGDMGIYGNKAGSTPNLDALAKRGIVFDSAYCNSPLCAPSRASMVTGRYVSEIGCLDNANVFSSEVPTMAHVFKRAGYDSDIVGKMHFVGHDQHHGFDQRLALSEDYSRGYNPGDFCLAYDWKQPPGPNPIGADTMGPSYTTDPRWDSFTSHFDKDEAIHKEAVRYLKEKNASSDPFFCCVSYHHPHNPFYIPEQIKAKFKNADLSLPNIPEDMRERYGVLENWLYEFHNQPGAYEKMVTKESLTWLYETYHGMVYDMDTRAGELLDILEANGLSENTVIVFTSDHGEMLAHRGMVQKRCFYERSVRVPLIFHAPGKFQEGKRIAGPVSLIDLLPTFAGIADVTPPEGLPGRSLMPSLTQGTEPEEAVVFSEFHGEGVHAPCFMALRGDYKYIYVHGHEELLYNLKSDPDEFHDLSGDESLKQVKTELKTALFKQFDPEAIARNALQSQVGRRYIFESHRAKNEKEVDMYMF